MEETASLRRMPGVWPVSTDRSAAGMCRRGRCQPSSWSSAMTARTAETPKRSATHEILLERRSGYLMSGEARQAYEQRAQSAQGVVEVSDKG